MRKVSKLVCRTDRHTLYSCGAKQIIADKARHPTDYKDFEYESILRKGQVIGYVNRSKSSIQKVLGI